MPGELTVDVAIVGGGPAGTSAALSLAKAGWSVVVIERSRYNSPRVGEILAPGARLVIESLGVAAWASFLDDRHLESPGIASSWGSPDLIERDFLFGVGGPAWHLDRRQFDASLARLAEEAGARVVLDARDSNCSREAGGDWRLDVEVRGIAPLPIRAQFLIDATGRPATLARRLGARRSAIDRLIAVIARVPDHDGPRGRDRRMLLEAAEDGWWYAASLPGGGRVVALMTDPEFMPANGSGDPSAAFSQALARTRYAREWVGPVVGSGTEFRRVDARSSRLDRAAGQDYLAIGDAALALDPLTGLGATKAIRSGLDAARAVGRHLDGDPAALDEYADGVNAEFARFLVERSRFYRLERRWADRPFWARRHNTT